MGRFRPGIEADTYLWSRTLKMLLIRLPRRTEHLCGITIKGKWEWDALRPGIRLFL